MTLPDPTNLTWFQWATTAAGFNPTFGQYVRPDMEWHVYARSLAYLLGATPRPELFGSWQEWVRALKQAVTA